jgi:ubiquinone/menaquinone biosynthesis C-methylase UbiE
MLGDLKEGDSVLDIPTGTGRLLPFLQEMGARTWAVDIEEDQLKEAKKEISKPELVRLSIGDVRDIKIPENSIDVSLMIRLTRWLSREDRQVALKELQRVSRKRIIFTARVRDHQYAFTYAEIGAALDGWHITRDETAGDAHYHVIMLEPDE